MSFTLSTLNKIPHNNLHGLGCELQVLFGNIKIWYKTFYAIKGGRSDYIGRYEIRVSIFGWFFGFDFTELGPDYWVRS